MRAPRCADPPPEPSASYRPTGDSFCYPDLPTRLFAQALLLLPLRHVPLVDRREVAPARSQGGPGSQQAGREEAADDEGCGCTPILPSWLLLTLATARLPRSLVKALDLVPGSQHFLEACPEVVQERLLAHVVCSGTRDRERPGGGRWYASGAGLDRGQPMQRQGSAQALGDGIDQPPFDPPHEQAWISVAVQAPRAHQTPTQPAAPSPQAARSNACPPRGDRLLQGTCHLARSRQPRQPPCHPTDSRLHVCPTGTHPTPSWLQRRWPPPPAPA